jgi:hypothetical protein
MASRMFSSGSSSVLPWLTQPEMEGHSAIYALAIKRRTELH